MKVWVGCSAKPQDLIGNGSGFATPTYLESLADEIESGLRVHSSFQGVAIHAYRRYLDLLSQR